MISIKELFYINTKKVRCPNCRSLQPVIRKPSNKRQKLFGGWKCKECNCEMDKFGKKLD